MIRRILRSAKRRAIWLADGLAIVAHVLDRRRPQEGLTILVYHRLAWDVPVSAPFEPNNVTPDLFRDQLDALGRLPFLTVVSAPQVAAWIARGTWPHGSYLLLTFDDVWHHVVAQAEELSLRRLPGVFFVTTAHVGADIFPFSPYDVWYAGRPGADPDHYRPATLEDCLRLRELGMDVQPHGHTHRALGRLRAPEVADELARSIGFVTQRIGQDAFCFAYPYGSTARNDLTAATEVMLRRTEIRFAVTTDGGLNRTADVCANAFRLRRTVVRADDRGLRFEPKAAGHAGALPLLKAIRYSRPHAAHRN